MKEKIKSTLSDAVSLCIELEHIAPSFGAHIALTGGTLYKPGERKDIDILIYRIRQVEKIDVDGFLNSIESIGIQTLADYGWVIKARTQEGRHIDFFFPERVGGPEFGNNY